MSNQNKVNDYVPATHEETSRRSNIHEMILRYLTKKNGGTLTVTRAEYDELFTTNERISLEVNVFDRIIEYRITTPQEDVRDNVVYVKDNLSPSLGGELVEEENNGTA